MGEYFEKWKTFLMQAENILNQGQQLREERRACSLARPALTDRLIPLLRTCIAFFFWMRWHLLTDIPVGESVSQQWVIDSFRFDAIAFLSFASLISYGAVKKTRYCLGLFPKWRTPHLPFWEYHLFYHFFCHFGCVPK